MAEKSHRLVTIAPHSQMTYITCIHSLSQPTVLLMPLTILDCSTSHPRNHSPSPFVSPFGPHPLSLHPAVRFYALTGPLEENMSIIYLHCPSSCVHTTMYLPMSIVLPAASKNSYLPSSVQVSG